jgi:hypothetical protein
MPDQKGDTKADEAVPETSLHAYKEGRTDDVKGDNEKLSSDDPKDLRASELEGEDEPPGATPKH